MYLLPVHCLRGTDNLQLSLSYHFSQLPTIENVKELVHDNEPGTNRCALQYKQI